MPQITLTKNAISQVENSIKDRGHGEGIRFTVKPSGCSGLKYVMEYVDKIDEYHQYDEYVTKHGDIYVVVDPKSMEYLEGMEVDFVKEGLNEGFKFNNPQVTSECGCGESFRV